MPLLEYHQSHINYEFRDHPKGNHGTLVLLHGFLEDSRMWKELTPNLEHIGSILMIDLPGHGKHQVLDMSTPWILWPDVFELF